MLSSKLTRLFMHLPTASIRNQSLGIANPMIIPRHFAAIRSIGVNEEIQKLIQDSEAVCFDVDSTVITEEGIDSLAAFKGVGQQVADLTTQ